MPPLVGKKQQVIEEMFRLCTERGNYVFTNDEIKEIARSIGFSNPFDATKLDSKEKLPPSLLEHDYGLVHLGEGKHRFVKGLDLVYHELEPIEAEIDWEYRKSILNE